jgi:hypothetical protein
VARSKLQHLGPDRAVLLLVALTAVSLAGLGLPGFGGVSAITASSHAWVLLPDRTEGRPAISAAAAQSLQTKIQMLSHPARGSSRPVSVSEDEANAFLKFHCQKLLPPGIRDPEVHITAKGISAAADIDFNQINQLRADKGDWQTKALAAIFRGKQRASASGKLETANGQGKIIVESAAIGNTPLPPVLVDWLIQNYIRPHYNIDPTKPFHLPGHVSRVELGAGHAVLLRSASNTKH